jgi:hypothetical protein
MNAKECLINVENLIKELEDANKAGYASMNYNRMSWKGYSSKKVFNIRAICNECGIFDWWNETLSMSQLKQMRSFLKQAIKLGFNGYVCFKVGAKYCSHGMWAHKEESTTGYAPDGDVLFHSFRSGDNFYDMELNNVWMHDKYKTEENPCPDFTLKQIKEELA